MASHHHHLDCDCRRSIHHHSHRDSSPHIPSYYTTSSPCFFPDSSPCCTQCSPPQPNPDHLLRLIASYLQNQQQTQPCWCETASTKKRQRFVNRENNAQQREEYDDLLRKIDGLDLSLKGFSSARRRERYSKVKDSAARVIQTRFRSYLVRRSVSLRELKELTRIESSFVSLRSSKAHFPLGAVSREATRLLLRLDSVNGGADSMIRDGKRRLCRELVRFLHYVDDCALRRRNVVSKRHVGGEERSAEKLKKHIRRIYVSDEEEEENIAELEEFRFVSDDGQEIPIVSSVGKSRKLGGVDSVKGNRVKSPVYELTSSAEEEDEDDGEAILMSGANGIGSSGGDDGSTSGSNNESGDGYTEVENIKYVAKENEEEDEESVSENEEESSSSSQGSKEEVQVSGNVSHAGRNENTRDLHLEKGSMMFSPPLPLKMEP